MTYPGITRAALAIAYDNGGIFAGRSEKQMLREFKRWLNRQPQEILSAIDGWLDTLTDEEMQIVCAGEDEEREAILSDAPPFTDRLLNDYFNEVC